LRFKEIGGSYSSLNHGQTYTFSGADTNSESCGGGTNAVYEVSMQASDLKSVRPGSYTTSLTVLVQQP
jgi:hypothetical protein